MIPLLSAFYFGSVEHYRLLIQHGKAVIDIGEHHVRQSYRTRTGIVGPNAAQDLCVRIEHDHGHKMPMRDVRLSYAETWPQQHLHAIRSAYGQAPWFIHFYPDVEALLRQRHQRLVDLDLASMRLATGWLGLSAEVTVSDHYLAPAVNHIDLRDRFHPKRALPVEVAEVPKYAQAFAERHGFVARRSVLDLVFNLGPRAAEPLLV